MRRNDTTGERRLDERLARWARYSFVGVLVLVLLTLLVYEGIAAIALALAVTAAYAARRRASVSAATSVRRWLLFVGLVVGLAVLFAIAWLFLLLPATIAGECGFDEVRCAPWQEWISEYGAFGFLGALVLAVLVSVCVASPRRRKE